jgi:hypothetical protein
MGITILGIWALAGGFAAFVTIFNIVTEYEYNIAMLEFVNAINAPLGGTYAFIEVYTSVIFAIALLVIGILTLKIRNKGVWAANIGISIVAIASLAWVSNHIFYVLGDPNYMMFIAGLDNQSSKLFMITAHYTMIAASAIRLHYLLGRNIRDFFNRASQQPFVTET